MYNQDNQNKELPESYFSSGNWIQFCARFGFLWYEFRAESLTMLEWAKFAYEFNNNIEVLLQAMDFVAAENPDLKKPSPKKIRSAFFDIIRKRKAANPTTNNCGICGGAGIIVVVEHCLNGNWKPLSPDTPMFPAGGSEIAAAMAQCTCSGGEQIAVDNRWGPRKLATDPRYDDMTAYQNAVAYVGNCIRMSRKQNE